MLRNDAEAVPSAVVVKPIRLLGEAAAEAAPLRSAAPSCQSDDATAAFTATSRFEAGAANGGQSPGDAGNSAFSGAGTGRPGGHWPLWIYHSVTAVPLAYVPVAWFTAVVRPWPLGHATR